MSRRMLVPVFLAAGLALSAQEPPLSVPQYPGTSFFLKDPKRLAVACAEEAQRLDASDAHLLAVRGDLWLGMGDRAKAETAFAEALAKDAIDPRTHRLIAQAWMRHGFKAEALAAYKTMAGLDLRGRFDNKKNVLCWAATDLMAAGFVPQAADYMAQSYALDKDDPNNCVDFARAALLAGERDLAARYFAYAVKAEPRDVDIWLDIASAHADYLLKARKGTVAAEGGRPGSSE